MTPSEVSNERIILSCLNWGKGHVARCIGLVEQLIVQQNEIIIAGDLEQIEVFKTYFPSLKFIEIPSYPFHFSGNGNFTLDLLKSRNKLKAVIQTETKLVSQIVEKHSISLIISDHRYGFFSAKIPSIFITHQLNLPLKWWQFPAQKIHNQYLSAFNTIWVMDSESNPLAGKLSMRKNQNNLVYIGHYSRFMNQKSTKSDGMNVLICNGPKPYDEQLLLKFINNKKIHIIAPKRLCEKYPNANMRSSENWKECDLIILNAAKIHAYCGYTTLMDAQFLQAKFELFPTIGQMEQEYLFELQKKISK